MASDDVETKRVFGDRAGKAELFVAASIGLVSVDVSGERVGRFGVAHRCDPADVAATGGRVAVATGEDVLLRDPDADAFEATGFGPAAAVGFDGDVPVAAGPDGRIGRFETDDAEPSWTDLGRLDAEVRAVDGRLLAAADGVYRLPDLEFAGLDDARDVAAAGPLAATGEGLYALGNGWMDELDGDFRVASAPGGRARAERADAGLAHAATKEAFYERRDGDWREVDLPVDGPVVDVAHGDVAYAVTRDGSVLAAGEGGWRAQALGVGGVVGCALR